jgi:hypothetical protein
MGGPLGGGRALVDEFGNDHIGLGVAAPCRYSMHGHCVGRYVDRRQNLAESSPIGVTVGVIHHERHRARWTIRHDVVPAARHHDVTIDSQATVTQRIVEPVCRQY